MRTLLWPFGRVPHTDSGSGCARQAALRRTRGRYLIAAALAAFTLTGPLIAPASDALAAASGPAGPVSAPPVGTGPGPITGTGWSGYITRININAKDKPITTDFGVVATWTVPRQSCQGALGVDSSDAIWVGLGGVGYGADSASGNLAQMGIETDCRLGKLSEHAVYQYIPGMNKAEKLGNAIKPGDSVRAVVGNEKGYEGANYYAFGMIDITQKWTWVHKYKVGFSNVPDSADWIVEAGQLLPPVCLPNGWCTPAVNIPLANFGTVRFKLSEYQTAPSAKFRTPIQKSITQFIATSGKTKLTAVTSMSQGSFSVTWKHPGV
jgi:hypothetical protein